MIVVDSSGPKVTVFSSIISSSTFSEMVFEPDMVPVLVILPVI